MAPPIVLLHGFTHTGRSWAPVIAALPERYRALAPDLRGHGSASGLRPVTLEAVLEDVDRLVRGPFGLVGYSMGGRIALHAALALAPRVTSLVLIGASPGVEDPMQRAKRRQDDEQLAAWIEQATIDEFAARWARSSVLAGQPEQVAAAARADRLRSTPSGLASALRGLGTGALPSLWDRLGDLAAPVTLVVGARDLKFREIATRMSVALPTCQTVIVRGTGHAAHLESPERVAQIIAAGAG